jgi:hypothetical protein
MGEALRACSPPLNELVPAAWSEWPIIGRPPPATRAQPPKSCARGLLDLPLVEGYQSYSPIPSPEPFKRSSGALLVRSLLVARSLSPVYAAHISASASTSANPNLDDNKAATQKT